MILTNKVCYFCDDVLLHDCQVVQDFYYHGLFNLLSTIIFSEMQINLLAFYCTLNSGVDELATCLVVHKLLLCPKYISLYYLKKILLDSTT
jgi:hypothetical protein